MLNICSHLIEKHCLNLTFDHVLKQNSNTHDDQMLILHIVHIDKQII